MKIVPLNYETYLGVIENSVGTNLFRAVFATVDGVKKDITEDGNLSCAFFVSSILKMFDHIESIHSTVSGTVRDLEKSGWQKIQEPKIGAVLVWEEKEDQNKEKHAHIGFYVEESMAVSNSSEGRTPQKHHSTYGELGATTFRKITGIFWKEGIEKAQTKV